MKDWRIGSGKGRCIVKGRGGGGGCSAFGDGQTRLHAAFFESRLLWLYASRWEMVLPTAPSKMHATGLRSVAPPPPPFAEATLNFQILMESTPPVALTRALFVHAVRKHKR